MGSSSIATGSHFCGKLQCMRKSKCFWAIFSAEALFAITAITSLSLNPALQLKDNQPFTFPVIAVIAKTGKTFIMCLI